MIHPIAEQSFHQSDLDLEDNQFEAKHIGEHRTADGEFSDEDVDTVPEA